MFRLKGASGTVINQAFVVEGSAVIGSHEDCDLQVQSEGFALGSLGAALLGWMPTALGVSIWHSVWCLGDRRFWREGDSPRQRVALGLRDARIGYAISLIIGRVFGALRRIGV